MHVAQHLSQHVDRRPKEEVAMQAQLHDLRHTAPQVHALLHGAVDDADLMHALHGWLRGVLDDEGYRGACYTKDEAPLGPNQLMKTKEAMTIQRS